MVATYEEQALALIEGGVDVLLVETAQDLLQAKIAAIGAIEAMSEGREASALAGAGDTARVGNDAAWYGDWLRL